MAIPKICHQFWFNESPSLPDRLLACHQSVRKLHPDWDIRLHRTADILEHRAFEGLHNALRSFYAVLDGCYRPLPLKSDLLKMCHVYAQGGIALDLDLYAVQPLDVVLNESLVLGKITADPSLVSEAVIGAEAGSRDVLRMIQFFLTRVPNSEGVITANLTHLARKFNWQPHESDWFVPHSKEADESHNYDHTENTRTIHLWGHKNYDLKKLAAIQRKLTGEADVNAGKRKQRISN